MTSSKKVRKFARHSGGPEGPSGRFWTQWIEPRGAALLSETLGPCYFVIKNHGPYGIMLVAGHGDLMDLPAGAVRASYAYGTIRAENRGEKSVLIEFDFLPVFKR
jgi:hypothetical protein